jgi:TrmH RNA methyltransferase
VPRRRDPHETEKVYGLNAALAVFAHRPEDIVRIAHTREVRRPIADMLRATAARHVPYKEVEEEELARIADSTHHEGLCLTVRRRLPFTLEALAERLARDPRAAALALDRVGNPHNLGAILRSAAYFGTDAVLLGQEPGQAQLTPAAVRVAEGGAEYVPVAAAPALAPALRTLRARGVTVIGTDARARRTAFTDRWPRPCVVVLGNERTGLSPEVREACEYFVAIPGGGAVDSLNVSVAAGVILAELARTRPAR